MNRLMVTLLILVSFMIEGIAQEKLKIGDVVNGKLKITNETGLKSFFNKNLEKSGSLGNEIKTDFSPTADRIFVYMKVTGNKAGISSIGVMLVNVRNEAYIVAGEKDSGGGTGIGGSATVTCIGNPCASCTPTIQWVSGGWLPIIVCHCNDPEGLCNMEVTFTVNINVGF